MESIPQYTLHRRHFQIGGIPTTDFTGTWKANLEKSKFLGFPPKALTIKIDQSRTELHQEIVAIRPDGNEARMTFACAMNGEQNKTSLNGNPIRGSATWQANELLIESWLKAGERELQFRDFWSLSDDRKTLVMEHREMIWPASGRSSKEWNDLEIRQDFTHYIIVNH